MLLNEVDNDIDQLVDPDVRGDILEVILLEYLFQQFIAEQTGIVLIHIVNHNLVENPDVKQLLVVLLDIGRDHLVEHLLAEDGGGVLTNVAVDNLHQHLVIDQDRDIGVDVLEGDATIYRDEPLLQRKVILHYGYSLRRTDWLPVAVGIELAINSPVEQTVHLYHTDGGHGCDGAVGHFLQHYLATIAQRQLVTFVCGIHLGDIEVLLHGCSQYGELADLGVQTSHLSL